MTKKKFEIFIAKNRRKKHFLDQKCILLIPSNRRREHPALQNMKFLNSFQFLYVIFDGVISASVRADAHRTV
jgi:hypothetical protein